ncbi:hypothetical protein DPMN_186316 [Dreissena polymorpha]|uniref:Uncharacterized protein n=1 Tax=Dreissena polymorpha TaxID=45954 RepID=A0A9D4DPG1_DREPO|nr:hypothetical protein DPMN_186316 [Dreissena polymorpha]
MLLQNNVKRYEVDVNRPHIYRSTTLPAPDSSASVFVLPAESSVDYFEGVDLDDILGDFSSGPNIQSSSCTQSQSRSQQIFNGNVTIIHNLTIQKL